MCISLIAATTLGAVAGAVGTGFQIAGQIQQRKDLKSQRLRENAAQEMTLEKEEFGQRKVEQRRKASLAGAERDASIFMSRAFGATGGSKTPSLGVVGSKRSVATIGG